MEIAVLGAGALGSVLAGTLSETATVTLIGHDNPHLRTIKGDGLVVRRPDGSTDRYEITATADHSAVAGHDVVLLAVKSYDTRQAMEDIHASISNGHVLTLQNGLGNVEIIGDFMPRSQILAGTTTNGAYLTEPGAVRHTGWGETTIGRLEGQPDELVEEVAETFRASGFDTAKTGDVEQALWAKVIINVGINPITALARVTNGRLVTDDPGREILEGAVAEAVQVAKAEGVAFESDPITQTKAVARETAENKSSMLQDILDGSRTEIGALNGAIVDRAEEQGIPVPVNRTLTNAVELLESGNEAPSS